jgi:dTDP-glucose 4,6-dehydratase
MIIVTGARGLLGRELVHQLAQRNARTRASDLLPPDPALPATVTQTQADLLDPRQCDALCATATCVIHAAARQHHSSPPRRGRKSFFQQNVTMTRNLLSAAERGSARHFVYVSSDMVYGIPRHGPFTEDSPPHPIGPYGRSKLAGEALCHAAGQRSSMKVTILRPRLIIGPGRLGVLTRLFDAIRTGGTVPLIGSGRTRYQMVGVRDVARACLLAIDRGVTGTFNLGSPNVPDTRTLLTSLSRRANQNARLQPTPRWLAEAGLWLLHWLGLGPLVPEQFCIAGRDYVLDITRAEEDLGWHPEANDIDMLWQAYQTYVGQQALRTTG